MANNVYTQDVILDADGKPVLDAMAQVQKFLDQIQKTVRGIGITTEKDAKAWGVQLAANLRALKQAQSDLKTLQSERNTRTQGFANYEKQERDRLKARKAVDAEIQRGERAQRQQALIEARMWYGEEARERKRILKKADDELREAERAGQRQTIEIRRGQLAADKAADAERIKSARAVRDAKLEAARASVTGNARNITNLDEARQFKANSDQRLTQLRREREAIASTDAAAAKGLAQRIEIEKALGRQLDSTINKLQRQRDTMQGRLSNINNKDSRLLIPGEVGGMAQERGAAATLALYKQQQAVARENLLTTKANVQATGHQRVEAQRLLDLANARVRAAKSLVVEENRTASALRRQEAAQAKANAAPPKTPLQNILSPSYAGAAFARTSVYGGAAMAAYGAFNAVTSSINDVIKLEDEMAKLQAISNSTDTQMQKLKTSIFDIGRGSRYSVTELTKISQTLAQAGVGADDMEKVLKSVTTLATASGSTPDEAVNLVTSALGSFQLQASEAARVSDLMTEALNRTKLTVGQVGQAIQYVGATAFEQNISLENLLATVASVAQAGVRSGSTIGTGFRQFLVDLQSPSDKLVEQLKRVGLTVQDVNVRTKGLAAVMDTLKAAGFGATQAYDALETRAAAFYLVAKNNTNVMRDLEISFAEQGAAAIANERAMNTLTAQWQRFRNILSEGFATSLDEPLNVLKNVLKTLSDRIEENRQAADRIRQLNAEGRASPMETDLQKPGEEILRRGFNIVGSAGTAAANLAGAPFGQRMRNGVTNPFTGEGEGLGDWIDSWTKSFGGAEEAARKYGKQIDDATDDVQRHTETISAADHEMARLQAMTGTVTEKQKRAQVETVSLTARFEGLVKFLGTTKDAYQDLIQAMTQYRGEEARFLADAYEAQGAAQARQNFDDRQSLRQQVANARGNGRLMSALTPRERGMIGDTDNRNYVDTFRRAAQNIEKRDAALARILYDLAEVAGRLRSGERVERVAVSQAGTSRAAGTGYGMQVEGNISYNQQQIEALNGMSQSDRTAAGARIRRNVTSVLNNVQGKLKRGGLDEGSGRYLQQAVATLNDMLQALANALKPTTDEVKDAAKARREAEKEEREANRKPLVTQADLDRVLRSSGAPRLGSGTRTPEEQEALFRRGVTPARGYGDRVSNHVNSVARDIPTRGMAPADVQRLAATVRAQLRAEGIEAQVIIEDGKTAGTGPHIHVGVRRGTRMGRDRSGQAEDRFQTNLSKDQLQLDETQLKLALEAVENNASDAAVATAQAALEKVNRSVMDNALDELAQSGVGPMSPAYQAKIAQVQQEISQNVAEFQNKLADVAIKAAERTLKDAQTAFEAATRPAQTQLDVANAQSSGLELFSNRGRVPDYVKQLAENRIARANENLLRAQQSAMPSQISAQEQAIAKLAGTAAQGADPIQLAAQLNAMNVELERLRANKAALDAQLGSGGLIPQTIGEGAQQAVQAFREANNLGASMTEMVNMNLGGGIQMLDENLTGMFDGIITGSQSALGAFGNFAMGVMNWLSQLAAQMLAKQVLSQLFSLIGIGAGATGAFSPSSGPISGGLPITSTFNGGEVGHPSVTINRAGGGEVSNGSTGQDSVRTNLARGEWVVRKRAVDSVGNQFMARLNKHGDKALEDLQSAPSIDMKNHTETNVYVVPPEQKPTLGPNDVLVVMRDDMMNGEGRRLIQHIARDN